VIGAGQIYADIFSQPTTLDLATITKPVRILFMEAGIPTTALYYVREVKMEISMGRKPASKNYSLN